MQEPEWHLHGLIFFLMLGYVYLRDVHIRVDIFRNHFHLRRQARLEVLGLLGLLVFGIPYTTLVTYMAFRFAWRSWLIDEGSAALTGLPHQWVTKFGAAFGLLVLIAALLVTPVRLLVYLFAPTRASLRAARGLHPIIEDSRANTRSVPAGCSGKTAEHDCALTKEVL